MPAVQVAVHKTTVVLTDSRHTPVTQAQHTHYAYAHQVAKAAQVAVGRLLVETITALVTFAEAHVDTTLLFAASKVKLTNHGADTILGIIKLKARTSAAV